MTDPLACLTKEDWQFVHQAVFERFVRAAPAKGEPPASKAFTAQRTRIETALMRKAYPSTPAA
jgi:hypothetical protein